MKTIHEALEKAKTRFTEVADRNADGRVSMRDVQIVLSTVASQADAQVHKRPWGGVVAAVVLTALACWCLHALVC